MVAEGQASSGKLGKGDRAKYKPEGWSFPAKNIPKNMQTTENKTGMRKAGATRFIIFTPPNTIKHNRIVKTIPYICKSCELGLSIGCAIAVPLTWVTVSALAIQKNIIIIIITTTS